MELRIFDKTKLQLEEERIKNHVRENIASDNNLDQVEYDILEIMFKSVMNHNIVWEFYDPALMELKYLLTNSPYLIEQIIPLIDKHLMSPIQSKVQEFNENENTNFAKGILIKRIKHLLDLSFKRYDSAINTLSIHWITLNIDLLKKKLFEIIDLNKITLNEYWPASDQIDFESDLDIKNGHFITTTINVFLDEPNGAVKDKPWHASVNGVLFQYFKEQGVLKPNLPLKEIKKVVHELTGSTTKNLRKFINKTLLNELVANKVEVKNAVTHLRNELRDHYNEDVQEMDLQITEPFISELFTFLIDLGIWPKDKHYIIYRLNSITREEIIIGNPSNIDKNRISHFFRNLKKLTSNVT